MSSEDDLSKTMVIPNPGGHKAKGPSSLGLETTVTPQSVDVDVPLTSIPDGENAVLSAARDIINLAANVRTLTPQTGIAQLRQDVEGLFIDFNQRLQSSYVSQEVKLTASYLLCCLVDELVLSTPWGVDSLWSQQTLLSKFHNETSGGEKFFLIVDKVVENASTNTELVELCYLCVSLGFKGKYRIRQTGESDILQVLNKLYLPISANRQVPNLLSPHGLAPSSDQGAQKRKLPFTLLLTTILLICVGLHVALLSHLNGQASPLLEKTESIAWDKVIEVADASSTRANLLSSSVAELTKKLSAEIAQGQVQIAQLNGLIVIRLISPQLFPPGSTTVNTAQLPPVAVLHDAIFSITPSIVVIGHTDSTGRAESNWSISRKRAKAVSDWLNSAAPGALQMVTRGMADTQPLVAQPDASANRRVELMLLPAGES